MIRVQTPDPAFDAMINKWTLYQALGCRLWGAPVSIRAVVRTAFVINCRTRWRSCTRNRRLPANTSCARRPGSSWRVTCTWWHPHTGRGVRTRFSDDLAWLPFVVDQYVRVTGDLTVLDAFVPFLSMREPSTGGTRALRPTSITDEHGDVYEHCRRALRRAATRGVHGLPLIGTGDWNDSMSLVGARGEGESVWLAWFLITLRGFAVHADRRRMWPKRPGCARRPTATATPSRRTGGTDNGIAARTSTTEVRWDPRRTSAGLVDRAELERHRRGGQPLAGRPGRCERWKPISCASRSD